VSAPLRLGLVGHPVGHSLSPVLHRAAGASIGRAVDYTLFDVPPAELDARLPELLARLDGLNVTLPHKHVVHAALGTRVDPVAAAIGAVNTLYAADGGIWRGTNTDAPGFLRALPRSRWQTPLVLGAGGAARAIVWALVNAGAERVAVANRSLARASELVEALAPGVGRVVRWADVPGELPDIDLLVNTTALGMAGGPDPARIPADVTPAALPDDAVVCDIVYRPRETPLLRAARAAGRDTVDGVGMLVHQGVRAFELWTGERVDPAPVEQAVRAALD
jgi:shikimate dehydrogenase